MGHVMSFKRNSIISRKHHLVSLVVLSLVLVGCNSANMKKSGLNESETRDLLVQMIPSILRKENNTKSLCVDEQETQLGMKKKVTDDLIARGIRRPSGGDIVSATYNKYSCPFGPYRSQVRPAVEKDIVGVWLFPESSQKLRHGPNSSAWEESQRIKCEGVAYYEGGEHRSMQVIGRLDCPESAKEMDALRKLPKVTTWFMASDGVVAVLHEDDKENVDRLELFVVNEPFTEKDVKFAKGDLLVYQRHSMNNKFKYEVTFRHLQRLE